MKDLAWKYNSSSIRYTMIITKQEASYANMESMDRRWQVRSPLQIYLYIQASRQERLESSLGETN